ncbi:MAG: oxidoreductase [Elusimicrobia bacterium RIFOXYA2_FULL_39_19]|nr:MAG: oxidoreductase [Elusimicrobia bacterium RIFOXYA2_FULL_39_19]
MKKTELALIGAGNRGADTYGEYVYAHSQNVRFTAVAEPNKTKRNEFADKHNIPFENRFNSWEGLFSKPKLADAALICTMDNMHNKPAEAALKKGYHVLLEKPMSNNLRECYEIAGFEQKYKKILMICHVLRYTPFWSTIKQIIQEGRIGRVISIVHNENVGHWHQAHSFVRGNWRNSKTSSPMILAKCCHDMDLLRWIADSKCEKISSFGNLTFFKKENAPKGSADRCIDCPVESECTYSALKLYLGEKTNWPASVISADKSLEARIEALKTGPYGKCAFKCDNNVVDHQVVNMEFENEVTVAFTMCAFSKQVTRTIKIMGTEGEIRGHHEDCEIEIKHFGTDKNETISIIPKNAQGHGGGDWGLMEDFIKQVKAGKPGGLTSAKVSLESHVMSFAAEQSRLSNKVIFLNKFKS